MRVLLVYPNMHGMNMLPPAIALFSALLKERGHTVGFFDATDYPNPEYDGFDSDKAKEKNLNARAFDDAKLWESYKEGQNLHTAFVKMVDEFSPDLLALSCTEDMFPIGESMLKRITHYKIPTIMGGVFPTFAPDKAIAVPEVDMICIGEGEEALTELCHRMERGQDYTNIPGLWVKKPNGEIVVNRIGPEMDINANPMLDISIFEESRLYRPMQGKVWKMFPLETHRGCPYKCAYCNSPNQTELYQENDAGNFFRKKSMEEIRKEIIHFRDDYQVEAFYFWADTFFAYSPKEFDEFIEMYSEFKIPFWCQTRPETITYERVKQLADIGMFRMAFGVEHGDPGFRKKYLRRSLTNDVIINGLREVNRVGVPFSVNNILGFPHENRDLAFETIRLNRDIYADSVNAYSFTPFHGTALRALAEQEGYIPKETIARSLTRPTMLTMPEFPRDQIEGLKRCFVLYAKMPESYWPQIEKAESLTPEGDKIWEDLRNICQEKYVNISPEEQMQLESLA